MNYPQLAATLVDDWLGTRPRRVGLGGGQGAGKSTLAALIERAAAERGLRLIAVGLDDFYRTRAERRRLAETVHPLLETRGPPGTHDTRRLAEAIAALSHRGVVRLPVFDKGSDDRSGERVVQGPFDVILLEGWCVGAPPLDRSTLDRPLNDLERQEDPDGRWRRFVADRLEHDYQSIWASLDRLVTLLVPDLACVRRWRLDQESERPVSQRLDAAAVDRFVQHYERVTRAMLATPRRENELHVVLGRDHAVEALDGEVSDAPPGG